MKAATADRAATAIVAAAVTAVGGTIAARAVTGTTVDHVAIVTIADRVVTATIAGLADRAVTAKAVATTTVRLPSSLPRS